MTASTPRVRIGVDLGGTKTELLALAADGSELYKKRVPTPAADYRAIIASIRALVLDAERALSVQASVGVGTPGALSPATGRLRNSNTTCLNGEPLDHDLCAALEREVRLENDANCFALSEAIDGAAAGARCVFGVILGTGVGGGIVIDARVLRGRQAIAGEWGHNPLPWPEPHELPGPSCYCGKRGCIETWLSGPGLARDHEHITGVRLDAPAIVARSVAGDGDAQQSLERYHTRLSRALATVINVLDPDAIVLGGGLSQIDELDRELARRLAAFVFSDRADTPILRAKHGDASGVRGAAWLWPAT